MEERPRRSDVITLQMRIQKGAVTWTGTQPQCKAQLLDDGVPFDQNET